MLRKLSWAAVALFVLADAVLVTLALRHIRPETASAAALPVTVTTSAPASDSAAAPTTAAPTTAAPKTAAPTTTAPTTAAPGTALGDSSNTSAEASATNATAASQPTAPGTSTGAPAETTSTTAGSTSVTVPTDGAALVTDKPVPADQRLMLDMSSDGSVIRAIRGTCPAGSADGTGNADNTGTASIEISHDGGRTWTSVPSDSTMVLRISATRGGNLWYVGTDDACRPVENDTSDGGSTWAPAGTAGSWFLGVDATSHTIDGPAGATDVGCAPVALAAIDANNAVIACTDGTLRTTDDSGDTWSTASQQAGVVAISFVSATHGYALAATEHCAAQVLETTTGAESWQPLACLAGGRPRGIAAAGRTVLAQVGTTLDASDDGGISWRDVPQQSEANG